MKKVGMMTTLLGAMAVVPRLMDSTKEMGNDMMRSGRKSSKMIMNKMNRRKTSTLIATGVGGYLLAHAAPIRSLIRER